MKKTIFTLKIKALISTILLSMAVQSNLAAFYSLDNNGFECKNGWETLSNVGLDLNKKKSIQNHRLVVFDNKLTTFVSEFDGYTSEIIIANQMDGRWKEISRIRADLSVKLHGFVVFKEKLFAIWTEGNPNVLKVLQVRIKNKKYDIKFIDIGTPTIKDKNQDDRVELFSTQDNLYMIWEEFRWMKQKRDLISQIRIANFDGKKWEYIEKKGRIGINKDPLKQASYPKVHVFDGKVYAIWMERDRNREIAEVIVAKQSSKTKLVNWEYMKFEDQNESKKTGSWFSLLGIESKMYTIWGETKKKKFRVYAYDGNDKNMWKEFDNGGIKMNRDCYKAMLLYKDSSLLGACVISNRMGQKFGGLFKPILKKKKNKGFLKMLIDFGTSDNMEKKEGIKWKPYKNPNELLFYNIKFPFIGIDSDWDESVATLKNDIYLMYSSNTETLQIEPSEGPGDAGHLISLKNLNLLKCKNHSVIE